MRSSQVARIHLHNLVETGKNSFANSMAMALDTAETGTKEPAPSMDLDTEEES
jgi:hypothetical protein